MLQLFRWCWHREDKPEQKLTQMQMILQEGECFIQQLRAMTALMQEAQNEHCAQLQNEMELAKEALKTNAKCLARFQNVMDLVNTKKAWDEHRVQYRIRWI
jgi:hypothetical protein